MGHEPLDINGGETMSIKLVAKGGLVLLGCGKMGSAMLEGWLSAGLPPNRVAVIDPMPSARLEALSGQGLRLNKTLFQNPAGVMLAVKPQMMEAAIPQVAKAAGDHTVFLSIAAGTPIDWFERALGKDQIVVRAMPNTPTAIGQGITAIVGNAATGEDELALAETLLAAIGRVVRLEDEAQMDAVTGLSGSGPAYVFHLIEAMAAAGEAEGLAPDLAMELATATVAGAGALALQADETPERLRRNVTSPNGTTQAGLEVLMAEPDGLGQLMRRTVAAAAARSRELGG